LQIPNRVVFIFPTVIALSFPYMQMNGHPGLARFDLLPYHSKRCFEICLLV